jgi:putative tryptophan/tyrosine transport system substrate-binding protein
MELSPQTGQFRISVVLIFLTLAMALVGFGSGVWWLRGSESGRVVPNQPAPVVEAPPAMPVSVPRIGYLSIGQPENPGTSAGTHLRRFLDGLREHGYIDGKNIAIEFRFAGGNPDVLPAMAAELIELPVDLIFTADSVSMRETDALTKEIPIVMIAGPDPVATGRAISMNRPGGNLTGLIQTSPELMGLRLQLLNTAVPSFSRIGIIYQPGGAATSDLRLTQEAARGLQLEIIPFEVRTREDLSQALSSANQQNIDVMMVFASPFFNSQKPEICAQALALSLPLMGTSDEWADSGALLSHSTDFSDLFYRSTTYVDKILRGTSPGELAIEEPSKFELVLNLQTAARLGVTIEPRAFLLADRIIE